MRTTRIYIEEQNLKTNSDISLNKDKSHYLSRVLRCKLEQELVVFNGLSEYEYQAKIIDINKQTVTLHIYQENKINSESPLNIHIGQAISKGEKLDLVIQKVTELGAAELTPLITERSESKKSNLDKKLEHWQRIAISAAEQCGRTKILKINQILKLDEWLTEPNGLKLTLDPTSTLKLKDIKADTKNFSLLIGPEGGLSQAEIILAQKNDFTPISLGPRVMRTETAPIAIVSIIQSQWGDV
jgi:16S rRNA (uracil1498-N3)-methyltransferase